MKTTRRNFIKRTGAAVGGAALLGNLPMNALATTNSAPDAFGFQVWTIRQQLLEDFPATLKKMAGMGYKQVEMCSPLGYSSSGFDVLNNMSGQEMRKIIEDCGLVCNSSHFNMGELRDHLDNRIEWANGLEMKQMVCSSFWVPEDGSVDEYRKAADELNGIGEKTKKAGIQMVFHNHHKEFQKRGDELIYDAILDELDPDLVKMQFQVAVVDIGYKATDYFRKHPDRFISAHLADYSSAKEAQVPVGQGIVDWQDFFKAAEVGGVKNYFVEMAPETFAPSAQYLLSL
ncbi:MAG TPA: TIM barrel protein [Tangfeifania sp.]|nr:TIM barrel protein [Tangfeifania sp.]